MNIKITKWTWSRITIGALGTAILLAIMLGPVPALAADPEPPPDKSTLLQTLEKSHDALSREIENLSERIDMFIGGKRVCEDSKESYIQAGISVLARNGEGVRYDHILRAKIDLPNTKDRFRLLIESDPEKELREPLSPGAVSTTESSSLAQAGDNIARLSAALQYLTRLKKEWQVSTDLGIRVRFPPDAFTRLSIKRTFFLGEWMLHGAETLFWFESIGAGESTDLIVEKHFSDCQLFRSATTAVWREQLDGFDLIQTFSFHHELSWKEVLTYRLGVTGVTNPDTHVKDWGFGVEYRRKLYKNWLFLAIEPAMTFSKVDDFKSVPSIRFSFETIFGGKYVD